MKKKINIDVEALAFMHTLEKAKSEHIYFTPMLECYKDGVKVGSALSRPPSKHDNQNLLMFEICLLIPALEADEVLFAGDAFMTIAENEDEARLILSDRSRAKIEALHVYYNSVEMVGNGIHKTLPYIQSKGHKLYWVDVGESNWKDARQNVLASTTRMMLNSVRNRDFPFDREFIISALQLAGHSIWLGEHMQIVAV